MSGTDMYLYGSAIDDDILLRNPKYLPRYRHLARKVLMHYAGDLYNPHVHGLVHEPFLRAFIKDVIAFKIFHRNSTISNRKIITFVALLFSDETLFISDSFSFALFWCFIKVRKR